MTIQWRIVPFVFLYSRDYNTIYKVFQASYEAIKHYGIL